MEKTEYDMGKYFRAFTYDNGCDSILGFDVGEGTGSEEPRNCKLYSYCTNPLVYDETFDSVLYADEEDTIKASVHVILKG